ncbi:glucose dehydrogenase (plasmid) [Arthrobacter sp. ZXY-2]|uniref:SDR family oxidoreductase n=1 Tax=Paenarthrobacter ureafaciens TaxID=37931 RepID=UPI0008A686AD|nr:glucose dehydrogenase [Arthrobacter sp. ZXY-2]
MSDFTDKVIVITGGSLGIGRSTARLLAKEGARVALVARTSEDLKAVEREIGNNAIIIEADVAETDAGERIVNETLRSFGQIDAVFANAGVFLQGSVAESDVHAIRRTVDVNVFATFGLVRAALPHMLRQGSGDIVITSSIAGHQALASEPIYSATKHAVQAFTHALRRQIAGSGVRVGEIAPGVVLTDLWGYAEGDPRAKDRLDAGTGILPEDVADAVQYMLSRPRHVTIRDLVILPSAQAI